MRHENTLKKLEKKMSDLIHMLGIDEDARDQHYRDHFEKWLDL